MAPSPVDGGVPVRFAHDSERRFADLLDTLGIAWEYEPVEFVLDRDHLGRARCAFRPDFYLPGFDMFLEVTTLRQALVTKKNAKIRRLRERYPHVRLHVLYRKDLAHLFARHGRSEKLHVDAVLGRPHVVPA